MNNLKEVNAMISKAS